MDIQLIDTQTPHRRDYGVVVELVAMAARSGGR